MALIGESGSGKTTLLRLLNRLAEPSSGAIFIQGHPATNQDPIALRRRLGYIPQDGGLFPHWTIRHNVCLVPQLLQWPIEQQLDPKATIIFAGSIPDGSLQGITFDDQEAVVRVGARFLGRNQAGNAGVDPGRQLLG